MPPRNVGSVCLWQGIASELKTDRGQIRALYGIQYGTKPNYQSYLAEINFFNTSTKH